VQAFLAPNFPVARRTQLIDFSEVFNRSQARKQHDYDYAAKASGS
jgi:hypothetical protein